MTLADKALSAVGTTATVLANFWPWLLAAFLLGLGMGAYPAFKITQAFYQRATLKAEKEISEWKESTATARAENLRLGQELSTAVLENRDAEKARLDTVAASLDELGRRVRLCAQKSDVRVAVTPSGAIATVPNGELRFLADAVREFAVACAVQRDRDAVDHNALVEWVERIRKRE